MNGSEYIAFKAAMKEARENIEAAMECLDPHHEMDQAIHTHLAVMSTALGDLSTGKKKEVEFDA